MNSNEVSHILDQACLQVGLNSAEATIIRMGENSIYRLPEGVVVRISRAGQQSAATKEISVAKWLEGSHISAIRTVTGIAQPVEVEGRGVTFWQELPPHSQGTYAQVADLIKDVHNFPIPDFLPALDPFVRLRERIASAQTLGPDEHEWMHRHLSDLEDRYSRLPTGLKSCTLHGDAHGGNVACMSDGSTVLLDLERFAIGPPEWDLMLAAFDYASCGWLSKSDYRGFVNRYGYDVMDSPRYPLLREIREFRKMLFAAQLGGENPELHDQAVHRLACLRGERGARPWKGWMPVP